MIKTLDNIASAFSLWLAKQLVRAKVSPMSVTVFRFIVAAPASIYFFSRGDYIFNILGLFSYMALAILDWADGEMAQLYKLPKRTAPFGRLIDHTSDRILMMIVLGSIMYAGTQGSNSHIWIITTILYYSLFFILTVTLYEFDKKFNIIFDEYPEIENAMKKRGRKVTTFDMFLYNTLYVHNNSITRICFTHNYLLIFGVITNQLLPIFIFITVMHAVRFVGIFVIEFVTLRDGEAKSKIALALRKRISL